jgi:hypothetical protein
MKKIVAFFLLIAFIFEFTSCGRHIAMQRSTNQPTTYLCPMHKEYISSQPGKCPKCGMALVSFDDYRNSKSGNQNQNRMPDRTSGIGGSGGGHAGHH